MLATSREALGVEGEQTWRVPSLSVGENASGRRRVGSGRLFTLRAQAVHSGFELDADNMGTVRDICARLDGIPLAIELAASRVTHLARNRSPIVSATCSAC